VTRPDDPARDEAVRLLEASVRVVLDDPEAAAAMVAGLDLGLDEQTVRESLPRLNLRVETASESRRVLEAYLSILYGFEPAAVGGSMPPDSFYGAE
jgi:NitT/TauT family transport system substrate-binding protein